MKKLVSFVLALLLYPTLSICAFAEVESLDFSKYSDEEILTVFENVCEEIVERNLPKKTVLDVGKQLLQTYLNLDLGDLLPISNGSIASTNGDSKDNVTSGMKNALRSAQSYLRFSAFSYSGLIDQLKYEGYTLAEATYAADNCGADWDEQAYKSAQSYLSFMAFSRSGLIEQLEYEGFTHEQAVYGVDKAY